MSSIGATIRKFDVYKKIPRDLSEGTNIGGFISIVTVLTILFLIYQETYSFLYPPIKSQLRPDDPITRQQMIINLDISFPRYPCQIISLDIQDMLLSHHPNIGSVSKRRLDKDGNYIQSGNFQILNEPNQMKQYEIAKQAFQKQYGCRLTGTFTVKQVPGNFHISSHAYQNLYARLMMQGVVKAVDTSHKIHQLYFGEKKTMQYVEAHHPEAQLRRLSKTQKIKPPSYQTRQSYLSHYHIDVVPTIYEDSVFAVSKTFQYTVNHNFAKVGHMPAVFFNYAIGGMIVDIYYDRISILQFLIELCAIVGGAYMIANILDGLLNRLFKSKSQYDIIK